MMTGLPPPQAVVERNVTLGTALQDSYIRIRDAWKAVDGTTQAVSRFDAEAEELDATIDRLDESFKEFRTLALTYYKS